MLRRKLIEEFTPAPRNNGHAKAFVKKNFLFAINEIIAPLFALKINLINILCM